MAHFRRTLLMLLVCLATNLSAAEPLPNIILILADDLGWSDVGFMGSSYHETPRIDQLASEGMVFTDAYANAPNCAPTRACLMSGQYAPRHSIYTVGNPARGASRNRKLIPTPNQTVLPDETVTMAEALRAAGYVTATIGKWHLGDDPCSQGFDVNFGGGRAGLPKSYVSPYRTPPVNDGPEGEYLTDRLGDEAVAFLKQHREEPFFLYLPHFAVHTPIQGKPSLVKKYEAKKPSGGQKDPAYAAMVESLDENVGRVLDTLDELKLTDNTLVIFTSDNGGHGGITSNAPLRGSKGQLYEGGIREPFVVRWPGTIEAGSRSNTPVITTDIYPTLLDIAHATPPDQPLDGESLVPLLTQQGTLEREALFWHFPAYLQPYTKAQGLWRTTPCGAVRQGHWKLIEYFEDGRLELYNLADDLSEEHNVATTFPDEAKRLLATMRQWRADINAPVPTQLNRDYRPQPTGERR